MSDEQAKIGNRIAAAGMIATVVSAIAAVATYFAKPELFRGLTPSSIETADGTLATSPETVLPPLEPPTTSTPQSAPAAPTTQVSAPPQPTSASPPKSLENGILVSLLSVASTPTAFVATFRISNDSDAPIMIAGRSQVGHSTVDFSLTDDMGTTCVWSRNSGNGRGTLPLVTRGVDPENYIPVAARESRIATVSFGKRYCTATPAADRQVSVSGTFTIVEGSAPRFAPVSFERVMPISNQ